MATWRARGSPKGGQPRAVLLTLTVAHSGDVGRDRADLGRGWKRFYDHLRAAVGGAFPFLLTWEVTEGADGLGHVHAHVVMLAPFFDWSEAASAWRRACPRSTHVNMRSTNAKAAAIYVSKYVTKGVQVGEMRGALAGHVLASTYGKRKVTTSRHFWRPVSGRGPSCCRRCEAAWRIVERPKSLTRTAPEAVWFALAEVLRVALPRGPTQASLRGVVHRGVG